MTGTLRGCHQPDIEEATRAKLFIKRHSNTNTQTPAIVDRHSFNRAVELLLPVSSPQQEQALSHSIQSILQSQTYFYYHARIRLIDLLQEAFLQKYIASGQLVMMSASSRVDVHDVIAIDGQGNLILSLTKDTYEACGLPNVKRAAFGHHRHLAIYNLKSLKKGKNLLQRLEWCFTNKMTASIDVILAFADSKSGASMEIAADSVPSHWKLRKEMITPTTKLIRNVQMADMAHLLNTVDPKKTSDITTWREYADEVLEWLGLASCDALPASGISVDPFISTYSPSTELSGSLVSVWWDGMLPPVAVKAIHGTLTKLHTSHTSYTSHTPSWSSLGVWGFEHCPASIGISEHGVLETGINDYRLLHISSPCSSSSSSLGDSACTVTTIEYVMLGEHDASTQH